MIYDSYRVSFSNQHAIISVLSAGAWGLGEANAECRLKMGIKVRGIIYHHSKRPGSPPAQTLVVEEKKI